MSKKKKGRSLFWKKGGDSVVTIRKPPVPFSFFFFFLCGSPLDFNVCHEYCNCDSDFSLMKACLADGYDLLSSSSMICAMPTSPCLCFSMCMYGV